jgi:hypothetical protein
MGLSFGPAVGSCLLAALLSLDPAAARAQAWVAELSAGQLVHDPIPAGTRTTGVTLALRHEGTPGFFAAAGIPFDSVGPPWGALGVGGRLATPGSRLRVGADLGVQGFGFHDRDSGQSGGGFTVEAMPVLAVRGRSAAVQVRSGVVHYGADFASGAVRRTVHQTDARVVLDVGWLALAADARHLRAPEGSYPYVGTSAETRYHRLRLWAYGGTWRSRFIETPVWGVGSRLRIASRTEVHLSRQQETNDPLYWNLPRRSWNIGLSQNLGRRPRQLLASALAVPGEAGVTFSLPLSASASAPSVAGDFSGWREVPMRRSGSSWAVTVPLPSGTHRYAFRRADGSWFVPEAAPGREEDGFGGFNAILIVP